MLLGSKRRKGTAAVSGQRCRAGPLRPRVSVSVVAGGMRVPWDQTIAVGLCPPCFPRNFVSPQNTGPAARALCR